MKAELLADVVEGLRADALLREARIRRWVRDDAWLPRASDDFEGCTE